MTGLRQVESLLRRVREVGLTQVLFIAEALCWLVAARLALRYIPVARILSWQQRPVKEHAHRTEPQALELARRVRHAVLVAARYAPAEFVCFPQCLAASAMLRRHGAPTTLHYGVTRQAGRLATHTWLRTGATIVIGGEVASEYSTLGIYKSG